MRVDFLLCLNLDYFFDFFKSRIKEIKLNKDATQEAMLAMIGPARTSNLPFAKAPTLNVTSLALWKVDLINGIKTDPVTKHTKPNVAKHMIKPCCFLLFKKTLQNVNKPPTKTKM